MSTQDIVKRMEQDAIEAIREKRYDEAASILGRLENHELYSEDELTEGQSLEHSIAKDREVLPVGKCNHCGVTQQLAPRTEFCPECVEQ